MPEVQRREAGDVRSESSALHNLGLVLCHLDEGEEGLALLESVGPATTRPQEP